MAHVAKADPNRAKESFQQAHKKEDKNEIFSAFNDSMISFSSEGGAVGQLVVRNIENIVKTRLQRRAKRHGRSMEEEVRDILRNAVAEEVMPSGGLGTDISKLFVKISLAADIAELRGHAITPLD